MAHQLVGTVVLYTRPVIVKPGFRRLNEEKNEPEEVAAVIKMVSVPAYIVGVEPRIVDGKNLCPNVHLAFLHPDQLHHLTGSGWRDAFERTVSVRPRSHPDVLDNEETQIPFYESEEVDEEIYNVRKAERLAKAEADAEAQAEKEKQEAGASTQASAPEPAGTGEVVGPPVAPTAPQAPAPKPAAAPPEPPDVPKPAAAAEPGTSAPEQG